LNRAHLEKRLQTLRQTKSCLAPLAALLLTRNRRKLPLAKTVRKLLLAGAV
jgi:hypothetical protein